MSTSRFFNVAQQEYGNAALLDLIATVSYYITLACFYNTLEVLPIPDPAAQGES